MPDQLHATIFDYPFSLIKIPTNYDYPYDVKILYQCIFPEEMLHHLQELDHDYDKNKESYYLFAVPNMQMICCNNNKALRTLLKALKQSWQP